MNHSIQANNRIINSQSAYLPSPIPSNELLPEDNTLNPTIKLHFESTSKHSVHTNHMCKHRFPLLTSENSNTQQQSGPLHPIIPIHSYHFIPTVAESSHFIHPPHTCSFCLSFCYPYPSPVLSPPSVNPSPTRQLPPHGLCTLE